MSDDIVKRLRESGEWDTHPMGGREWFPDELCEEAADEIDRLRAELKDADDDFHALKAMFDKMRAEVRGE